MALPQKSRYSRPVNNNTDKWSINVKLARYSENGELQFKLAGFKYTTDIPAINRVAPDVFKIKQDARKACWICVAPDKAADFPKYLDALENALKATNNYEEKSIQSTIDKMEDFLDSTPTPDDVKTNEENIATNWRELLKSLSDPEVRKRFLLFQTTYTCESHFKDAILSPSNVASVLAADPQATFVTNKETWRKRFNRTVQPNAPFVIITRTENIIPIQILAKDPVVIKAGGWNALVKASGGMYYGAAYAAIKRARKHPDYQRLYPITKDNFFTEKAYDVRYTTLIPGAKDVFNDVANLVNNLTGQLNQLAKNQLDADNEKAGIEPNDYDAKREGLETNEQLIAFKEFILKKCKSEKINVAESSDIQETIANAVYAYAFQIAGKHNKLSDHAREKFAAAVCYAVAYAFNIKASRVNSSISIFERLSEEEAQTLIQHTYQTFKNLSGFRMNEDINDNVISNISFGEYENILKGLLKNKNNRARENMKENFSNFLTRLNNVPK